MLLSNIRKSV